MEAILSLLAIFVGIPVAAVIVFKLAVYGTLDSARIAEIEAERKAQRRAERLKHVDVTGYEFTENGLRYAVDRSELLAEKTWDSEDEESGGRRTEDDRVVADRLFFDTLLRQPFYIRSTWSRSRYETKTERHHWVFYERADLLEFVHREFPEKLREIMRREFSYADFDPTDEEILHSLEGTSLEDESENRPG